MKILLTGSAGFIGSHVATALLRRGDEVIGLDNFNDYYDVSQKRANVAEILTAFEPFRCIEADVRDRQVILDLCEEERFDAIIHLAAMAGVRNSVKHPDLYVSVDYNGSQNMMDGARLFGVSNFVMASTSSIYGNTTQIPFVETDPCDQPIQPYAAAKRGAEMLGYTYHYLYDLNFTATRFFTVYGPKGRPDMMAYLLADSIHQGREIPYYNSGEMWRDWTFVDDIVDGIVRAVDRPLGYEILNLGRGEPTLLKEFVTLMETYSGGKANLVPKPKMTADMDRTYADISKAARLIGYNPQVNLADGVKAFWDWYISKQEMETK
ncbi:MAG: NAD-dependent epimerase/dehydratase family protein [Chloroflexota bacterium]